MVCTSNIEHTHILLVTTHLVSARVVFLCSFLAILFFQLVLLTFSISTFKYSYHKRIFFFF